MQTLTVTTRESGRSFQEKKITGFAAGELEKLKQLPHEQAREALIKILDKRNGNLGTCWELGYGVYGLWFDNEAAYLRIGASCD